MDNYSVWDNEDRSRGHTTTIGTWFTDSEPRTHPHSYIPKTSHYAMSTTTVPPSPSTALHHSKRVALYRCRLTHPPVNTCYYSWYIHRCTNQSLASAPTENPPIMEISAGQLQFDDAHWWTARVRIQLRKVILQHNEAIDHRQGYCWARVRWGAAAIVGAKIER